MFFTIISRTRRLWRPSGLALLLALTLCLLLPQTSKAYSILLRSDPSSNAVLKAEPVQVRLWFSEQLNPDSSTASIVNSANQRMDVNGGLVLPTNVREMDISLRPDLLPGVYVVTWHTQSANDGQVFSGAFPFSIANPSGSLPIFTKPLPNQSQFAVGSGLLDSAVIFRWLTAALVDLCVIFWVSGKVWHSFVLDPAGAETAWQREIALQSQQRFTQRYSLPILRVLFLANIGVLAGQALALTAGRWDLILAPTLLVGMLTNGNFGGFWLISTAVIALAIMLETMVLFSRQHTPDSTSSDSSSWLDLLLCLLLLILTTLTSYTTTSRIMPTMLVILVAVLYLLAATVWLGGLFYLVLIYLPILRDKPPHEKALSLLMILQRFVPLAMSAAIIMILSGIYNAILHQNSYNYFYEPYLMISILITQIVCIMDLLVAGVRQIFSFQPALEKEYEQYERDKQNNGEAQGSEAAVKVQEKRLMRNVKDLTWALCYMLLPGVIVILCMALMSILVGSF